MRERLHILLPIKAQTWVDDFPAYHPFGGIWRCLEMEGNMDII